VLVGCPRSRSKVVISRLQRLWLKVSCRWKKVRNAGSEGRSARVLALGAGVVVGDLSSDARRLDGDCAAGDDRHI